MRRVLGVIGAAAFALALLATPAVADGEPGDGFQSFGLTAVSGGQRGAGELFDDDNGDAARGQLRDDFVQAGDDERGQAHRDLVEQQDLGVGDQRAREGQHLLLAA